MRLLCELALAAAVIVLALLYGGAVRQRDGALEREARARAECEGLRESYERLKKRTEKLEQAVLMLTEGPRGNVERK